MTADELASTAKRSPFQAKFIVDTSRFGMGNGGPHVWRSVERPGT